jgi:hypothetical protein
MLKVMLEVVTLVRSLLVVLPLVAVFSLCTSPKKQELRLGRNRRKTRDKASEAVEGPGWQDLCLPESAGQVELFRADIALRADFAAFEQE